MAGKENLVLLNLESYSSFNFDTMKTTSLHQSFLPKIKSSILLLAFSACCFSTLQGQTLHDVGTSGNNFVPVNLTIQVGDTFRWTNNGGFHNVVADDGSFRCANGCDGMGGNGNPSGSAWSFTIVFNSAGLVPYF